MSDDIDRVDTKRDLEKTYREGKSSFLQLARRVASGFMDAEDVVHDAFVNALARADVAAPVTDYAAWIYAGIRNRLIDLWRRESVRREKGDMEVAQETLQEIVCATGLDPSDAVVQEELADALADAISSLPPQQREVIVAQVFDAVSFRELSERTGISMDTLAARKRAAVRSLGRALRDWIDED